MSLTRYVPYLRRATTALLLLTLLPAVGLAQRVVTGLVADENNAPMPGTTVVLKGSTKGTTTNAGGEFSLNVPGAQAVLDFSAIGYTTVS